MVLHDFLLFSFSRVSNEYAISTKWYSPVSLSAIMISGLLCSSLWSVCLEKSHSIFVLSRECTFSGVCSYHLGPVENPYLLHITQLTTTPTLSCSRCWYCLCASILYLTTTCWLFDLCLRTIYISMKHSAYQHSVNIEHRLKSKLV